MDVTTIIRASVGLFLKLINILLHGVGLYLLRSVQKRSKHNIQLVYITNLSVVELMINLLSFTRNLLKITGLEVFKSSEFELFLTYSYIFDYAILKFSLYMTMILLTLDRLFLITLNAVYRKHCNPKRATSALRSVWFMGMMIFLAVAGYYAHASHNHNHNHHSNNMNMNSVINCNATTEHMTHANFSFLPCHLMNMTVPPDHNGQDLEDRMFSPTNHTTQQHNQKLENRLFFVANFVVLVFDFLFLPIAIISYTLIFWVYTKRQKVIHSQRSHVPTMTTSVDNCGVGGRGGGVGGRISGRSRWKSFQKSRFYVSMLLIITFVVFVIPADILWTVYSLRDENRIVSTATTISYALSYLCDGLIYIAMNPKVKHLFIKLLKSFFFLKGAGDMLAISFYESERSESQHFSKSPYSHKKPFLKVQEEYGGRQTVL